ncbi:VOC family protein [Novosphingobium pentaromativorans]|uniref:Glyoxalase/bleomycin resistance protein/dioxygenase n=1 Tax=Novosphingobium pentaromativorans US6-1 TaxID=1088721 RepID=G6EB77_9SPHN|nr:VOC family protein [Novosphingobium pentaromativorans]AIT80474.1 oxidoreductase [Novosphingobium pentaromativorans US6-1]EHJ61436.1 glyoxalase/bleomycin resistance protein/dioxygenase [Novosphingobium pentaromativorans US6-1]
MPVSVSDLQYVALAVPDLAAERSFFGETWGLVETAEQDGKVYFAAEASSHPYVIRLREDAERKTDLIGFSAASRADVDALFAQVEAAGCRVICEPATSDSPAGGYAFRFFDPDGRAIEIVAESSQRSARALARGEAIPQRISHVVLHTPDVNALADFYRRVLGFRLSDWIGEFMVFLRCNPAHHRLAILPGPPALNHIAFDVASVDELMRGLARMHERGVSLSWGPGRHTAGNNTFTYYVTPNGNAVEYTSDLEEVDEANWEPQVYEMAPSITDQWGTGRIIPGNVPHAEMTPDKGLWQVPA